MRRGLRVTKSEREESKQVLPSQTTIEVVISNIMDSLLLRDDLEYGANEEKLQSVEEEIEAGCEKNIESAHF